MKRKSKIEMKPVKPMFGHVELLGDGCCVWRDGETSPCKPDVAESILNGLILSDLIGLLDKGDPFSDKQIKALNYFKNFRCKETQAHSESNTHGKLITIEVAPTDGSEIIAYHEDYGVMLARYTSLGELLSQQEIDGLGLNDEDLFEEDWFFSNCVGGGRLDRAPTHWMPLPEPPIN